LFPPRRKPAENGFEADEMSDDGSRDPFPRGKAIIRAIEQKGVSERNLPWGDITSLTQLPDDLVSCFG
jgi:hypothetical protein